MRVLFVFNLAEMQTIIYELAHRLQADGVEVLIYDFISSKKYDPANRTTVSFKSYWWAPYILKIKYLRRAFIPLINRKCIEQEFRQSDNVHFQYVHPSYLQYIKGIEGKGCRIITTFWGSDYLKANTLLKQSYQHLLSASSQVACARVILNSIANDFPEFKEKCTPVFFGVKLLDLVSQTTDADKALFKKKYNIPSGKILMTAGYNAAPGQQHEKLIQLIQETNPATREQLHVIVPLTYGGSAEYKEQVKNVLTNAGISHTLLLQDMEITERAVLRSVSDIVVNIQVTDAFAESITESIEGGNVLIVGEWLPYHIYEEWGIVLIRSSMEAFTQNIENVVSDLGGWKKKVAVNKGIAMGKLSWDAAYPMWKSLYREKSS